MLPVLVLIVPSPLPPPLKCPAAAAAGPFVAQLTIRVVQEQPVCRRHKQQGPQQGRQEMRLWGQQISVVCVDPFARLN